MRYVLILVLVLFIGCTKYKTVENGKPIIINPLSLSSNYTFSSYKTLIKLSISPDIIIPNGYYHESVGITGSTFSEYYGYIFISSNLVIINRHGVTSYYNPTNTNYNDIADSYNATYNSDTYGYYVRTNNYYLFTLTNQINTTKSLKDDIQLEYSVSTNVFTLRFYLANYEYSNTNTGFSLFSTDYAEDTNMLFILK